MTKDYGERQDQKRFDEKDEWWETRDPASPPEDSLDRIQGRLLDPATAVTIPGLRARPTIYVGPALLISRARYAEVRTSLESAAERLGWELEEDPNYPPKRVRMNERGEPVRDDRYEDGLIPASEDGFEPAVIRVLIKVKTASQIAPDGWTLLQQARSSANDLAELAGVGLDHVVEIHPRPHWTPNPRPHWTPNPDSPLGSYGFQGSGGRQPVAYAGPRPRRTPDDEFKGRRPVVAILDTGCGEHPWLDFVEKHVTIDDKAIGYVGDADDPETGGDYVGPLDGGLDPLSGHGTFIAGLVHQRCPDADIIAWRVVDSDGPVVESFAIDTLRQVVELVERHAADGGGRRIDVLNLSMGYYHETPDEDDEPQPRLEDPTLRDLLMRLGKCGVSVVCSAGNDATARKLYPAAFAPRNDQKAPDDHVPVTSVGADNPNGTVALFSNTGKWVRCYAPGAAVLSTMPPFEGGLLPVARFKAAGLVRESMDPDDYRALDEEHGTVTGGFALWSGTSFAAPIIAGEIAQELVGQGLPEHEAPELSVQRVGAAVTSVVEQATSWKGAHGKGPAAEGATGE